VADTVGFLRDLPHGLVAAFRATLEEVEQAALILHVSDISSPGQAEQDDAVRQVLAELGVEKTPRMLVFNKTDLLEEDERRELKNSPRAVFVSALEGLGLDELRGEIERLLPGDVPVRLALRFSAAQGRERALVHERGRVLSESFRDGMVWIEAEVPESLAHQLGEYAVKSA